MAVAPIFADDASKVLADDKSKVSYAIGVMLGSSWQQQQLDVDPQIVERALKDVQSGGKTLMTVDECKAFLQEYQRTFGARLAEKDKADGEAFLEKNKKQKGVVTLPDGLQYKIITEGSGASPTAEDVVTVNYSGKLINGTEFDSSYKRGQPAQFQVGGVIPGWTEALQKMKPGSKWQLFIPSELAYGERGNRGIPPNSTLVFDVELLSVQSPQQSQMEMPQKPRVPLTSGIIKVQGTNVEMVKPEELQKMQATNSAAR